MRPVAFTYSQLTLLIIHPRRGENGICFGKFKASRAIRLTVSGACQYVGTTGPTVRPIRKAPKACDWSAVLSACRYVGSTDPTVLPIRKVPLALMYDPLDNHEIAFGVVHFALRFFP